jgi:hypothetical protein
MSVALRHPQTREIKIIAEGWSWGCFIGSGILGLPLYRRGLPIWGSVMVVFNIVALIVGFGSSENAVTLYLWMSVIGFGLCVFFGIKANQMAIDRYLSLGWEVDNTARKFF